MSNEVPVNSIERVFIEGENVYVKQRPLNEKKYSIVKNIVKNGKNIFIDITPGYDYNKFKKKQIRSSEHTENNILRNNNYRIISDKEFLHLNTEGQQKIFPYYDYNDVDNIKRKNRVVSLKFNKSIGINNNLDYIDYKSSKFKDIDDKIKYLIDSNDEDDVFVYPWVLNDFDIDSRGSNIDLIGSIQEIKRDFLFITNIKGFKASYSLNDMRKRNITINDKVDYYNTSNIENFLDRVEDNILYFREKSTKLGKFEKIQFNGNIANKFNITLNREIESTNHNLHYISEESKTYKPFKDREEKYAIFQELVNTENNPRQNISSDFKSYFNNNSWNENSNNKIYRSELYVDGVIFNSRGRDFDYSINNGIESLAFIGELD